MNALSRIAAVLLLLCSWACSSQKRDSLGVCEGQRNFADFAGVKRTALLTAEDRMLFFYDGKYNENPPFIKTSDEEWEADRIGQNEGIILIAGKALKDSGLFSEVFTAQPDNVSPFYKIKARVALRIDGLNAGGCLWPFKSISEDVGLEMELEIRREDWAQTKKYSLVQPVSMFSVASKGEEAMAYYGNILYKLTGCLLNEAYNDGVFGE